MPPPTALPSRWQCAIRSDVRYVPWVRRWVAACVADAGMTFPAQGLWRCSLVLTEAVTNAMRHAGRTRPAAWIDLELQMAPRRMTMTVTDGGPPFALPARRCPPVTHVGGRGVYLMRAFCRRVTVQRVRGRNRVRMWYQS